MQPSPNLSCAHCQTTFHYREAICPLCQTIPSKQQVEVVKFSYRTAVIRDICTQYEHLSSCFYEETIPTRKQRNAIKHFPIDESEKIIMLGDTTLFGSNKQGFAICEFGFYWRNDWTTPTKRTQFSWDEFAKRPLSLQEYALEMGRGDAVGVAAVSEEDRPQILDMLQKIQAAIL